MHQGGIGGFRENMFDVKNVVGLNKLLAFFNTFFFISIPAVLMRKLKYRISRVHSARPHSECRYSQRAFMKSRLSG